MASAILNIARISELRNRILYTLALLAVYRFGIFISTPGVDRVELGRVFRGEYADTLFGFFNMFSGGAFEQASIFALGIMPYISASIIMQLLNVVIPTLERLQKEGEAGRKKINQYTRYGTILLSLFQGYGVASFLVEGPGGQQVVHEPGMMFYVMTVVTLTAGTTFVMWLGEQITERGIGNGISLIIFAGIAARLPEALQQTFRYVKNDLLQPVTLLMLIAITLGAIAMIVYFEQAQRRIPVQYAKRMTGQGEAMAQTSHLPLKINIAGVIPPIFASSLLMFPATISRILPFEALATVEDLFRFDSLLYNTFYVGLIVFFCFFYTAVTFNPVDVADNMKKNGGYVPGIRPGRNTAEYIDRVLSRITVGGAIYLSIVCILPTILMSRFNVPPTLAQFVGGTSILIVVSVALETVRQIESHLITRHYDGFSGTKGAGIRARRA